MSAKKDRKGSGILHVPSQTEAMGLGGRMKAGDPNPVRTQREVAGLGAGKKSSAQPIKTIHKGKGWDGPKPRVALPKGTGGKK